MKKVTNKKFAFWKGIPREKIDWHPEIHPDKCVGCGMCIVSCGRDVFGFDAETRKAFVVHPMNCMVDCTSCETWCVFDAISFPDRRYVRDVIKKNRVLVFAGKELQQRLTN